LFLKTALKYILLIKEKSKLSSLLYVANVGEERSRGTMLFCPIPLLLSHNKEMESP
jgi:hypothetical protein